MYKILIQVSKSGGKESGGEIYRDWEEIYKQVKEDIDLSQIILAINHPEFIEEFEIHPKEVAIQMDELSDEDVEKNIKCAKGGIIRG